MTYGELRDMPLPELFRLHAEAERIAQANKRRE